MPTTVNRATLTQLAHTTEAGGVLVNDVHSQLNPTRVRSIEYVRSTADVQRAIRFAREAGLGVCVGGGRHAMGGQQFGAGMLMLDTRAMRRVLGFDAARGTIEVEAGIQWPELVEWLWAAQRDAARPWAIRQKQTGADRLTIGGAIAANVHGRGLTMKPFIDDVEALTLVNAEGELVRCSRTENAELFRLVVGGYGLFGVVVSATLRLAPRRQLERIVEIRTTDSLMRDFDERIAAGFTYGDFQFAIDPRSPDFLHRGILSAYRPLDVERPMPATQRALSDDDWARLLHLAHFDKAQAWERYAEHYLASSGQLYWSDTHQLSTYLDDYHAAIDAHRGGVARASEMITEIYVPRHRLADFMASVADDFREHGVDVVYGTIRLIERDEESVLAWARQPWVCVIFNLHVEHTRAALGRAAEDFRRLIDLGLARGGTYYLTYHRWATREQVLAGHPRVPEFLGAKAGLDPEGVYQSEWYRGMIELLRGRESFARG